MASYGLPLFLSSGVSTLGDIERALQVTGQAEHRAPALHHLLPRARGAVQRVRARQPARRVSASRSGSPIIRWIPCWCPPWPCLTAPASWKSTSPCRGKERAWTIRSPWSRPGSGGWCRASATPRRMRQDAARARLDEGYGADRVAAVLGTGVKELAAVRAGATTRGPTAPSTPCARSRPGAVIAESDVAVLRTEKVLRPGLGPEFLAPRGRRAREEAHPGRRRHRVGGPRLRPTLASRARGPRPCTNRR